MKRTCPPLLPAVLGALGGMLATLGLAAAPAAADHEWVEYEYRTESPHPYPDDNDLEDGNLEPLRIRIPGARAYQIRFSAIDVEPYYDAVELYALDPGGSLTLVQTITGAYHEFLSKAIVGVEAWVVIRSDSSNAGFGWRIDGVRVQIAEKGKPPRPGLPSRPHPVTPGEEVGPGGRPFGPGHAHGGDPRGPGHAHGGDPHGPEVHPGGYLQALSDVEFLFGVEGELYEMPDCLTMAVGDEHWVVIQGRDQFGQPMPVLARIHSEGFAGNATLKPDREGTYVLTAGHHAADAASIRVVFPQNPAFNRTLQVRVRPRFEFTYRDSGRKINLNIYTGVHRHEVAGVNVYHSIDPSNLTGGEDVTALVKARTGPHSTLFLEADHAYPLQKAVNYFTMVLRKTDGREVRMTYSIEYKKANPTPVGR